MKRRSLLFIIALVSVQLVSAQEAIEKEVNEVIWKPFMETWNNYDAQAFNDLHTDDVIRAGHGQLTVGKAYKTRIERSFAMGKENNIERQITFRFEERAYSGNTGYEVGYFKVDDKRPGQEARTFYGRFHVVLKKINGVWKIAQDWDSGNINGHEVGEKDWLNCGPVDF